MKYIWHIIVFPSICFLCHPAVCRENRLRRPATTAYAELNGYGKTIFTPSTDYIFKNLSIKQYGQFVQDCINKESGEAINLVHSKNEKVLTVFVR